MKKKYKKPEIVFEKLAFKSALATCGYVSTAKITNDMYPCYIVEGEGNKTWPLGKGEPAYMPEWGDTLINGDMNICSIEYYCYHVPADPMLEGKNENYTGLS